MATRYYSYDPRAEWEPVERWENEGGRLDQSMTIFSILSVTTIVGTLM